MEQFDWQFPLEVWEVYRLDLLLCWYQGLEEQLKRRRGKDSIPTE
jgi:hypothetical protein